MKYLKLKQWLILSLMSALGFGACKSHKSVVEPQMEEKIEEIEERSEIRLMYGVPTMDYRVRGKVIDENGKPVSGVKLNMLEPGIEATADTVYGDQENVKKYLQNTSVTSDEDGRFEVSFQGVPQEEVRVLARDVDGSANGQFKNQLLNIKVDESSVDKKEAKGWNRGSFKKEVTIKLERK
ncbi:MAG: radical SAM-associated putative lipoprotein [Bacteroidales bacterium]|nr:radical SAM-associated putative lipoprotein [Bacteroidales bacterium]